MTGGQAEDALKHVFQCEYDHHSASADSLAGALRISRERRGLWCWELTPKVLRCILPASGREYALQVLRAHRLYETYLARETGLGASEWHRRAENR